MFDSDKGSTAQRVPVAGKITKLMIKQDQEVPVPYEFIEIDTDQKGGSNVQEKKEIP